MALIEFSSHIAGFNQYLNSTVQNLYTSSSHLDKACQYAMSGEGKRIRPLLCILSHIACGGLENEILPAALSVEMIHTYSLVHDDLPSMDNDDLRRGRPTLHKVYPEAIALLAGDALLTDAFSVISQMDQDPKKIVAAISALSSACGSKGMVGGQDADMYWTGKSGYSIDDLTSIHNNKTGKLISASCKLGAIFSQTGQYTESLAKFGQNLGLAFQIVDDLIDQNAGTGKSSGKDQEQGKLTFLAIMDSRKAEKLAEELTEQAFSALDLLGPSATQLKQLAQTLLSRNS